MTDDAPSTGTPDVDPDRTVMKPADPGPTPVVDNPDVASPPPPAPGAPATQVSGGGGFGGFSGFADPAEEPIDPEFPTRLSRAGLTGAVVALGTGLLGASVVISAFRSRQDDELDWSVYGVGLGATAVLLVVALLAALAARRTSGGRAREEAVTWPGVVGILAVGLMMAVGIDAKDSWVGYLIGAVVFVLAAIGYLLARRAAFVVTAIVGLGLVYFTAFDDLIADKVDQNGAVVAAAVIGLFVVVVTLLGWLLPTRAVSGVAVGAFGVLGYVGVMLSLLLTRFLSGFFGSADVPSPDGVGPRGGGTPFDAFEAFTEADVWWVLAFAGALTVMWALAAAISNHAGFSILAIAMPSAVVPLATVALAIEHPTTWSGVLAVAGGVLLLAGVLVARVRSRRLARELPVGAGR